MCITVQGIGPVGGFGAGAEQLAGLFDGSRKRPPEQLSIKNEGRTLPLSCFRADTSRLDEFIPPRKLRRVDRVAGMALLGASLAISDAKLPTEALEQTGIVLATGYGALDTGFSFVASFLDKGDQLSKPTFFSNSVHNAAAAYLSIFLGIKGPCLTVTQFDLSVPTALLTAVQWLEEGRVESVLVGGVDQYNDVLGYAAATLCSDRGKAPVIVGEGGGFFVLSKDRTGNKKGYAEISGVDLIDPLKTPISTQGNTVIMGSTGHGACSTSTNAPTGPCLETYYGNFPAAAALDICTACLALKDNSVLNTINGKKEAGIERETIQCMKPGNDHLWGVVTLKSNPNELHKP